jgi:CheY-like chemotaxis protein
VLTEAAKDVLDGASDVSQQGASGVGPWPSAPEDALEPTLGALVEESGARAGAMCLFERGEGVLRLAAEVGLSDDGCRLLRTTRPGEGGWNPPLASVLEGRACVVEAGTGSIPPLVERAESVSAVACVPLLAGGRPRGSVVLVAVAPRTFTEHGLRRLAPAVRRIEQVVEAIARRVHAAAHEVPETGGALASVARATLGSIEPVAREVQRLIRSTRGQTRAGQSLENTVRALRNEGRRLAAALAEATARERQAREELALLGERAAADREETLRQAREMVEHAEEARAAAAAELEAVREDLADAQVFVLHVEERYALTERGAAGREETLRYAVEAQRRSEELRAAAAAEAEALRGTLATGQARILEAEAAARAARGEWEQMARALEDAQAREAALHSRLASVEAELARLQEGPRRAPDSEPARPSAALAGAPAENGGARRGAEAAAASRMVAVLDADATWGDWGGPGVDVAVLEPTSDLPARLASLAPLRVLVNLAAPGAFEALSGLRAAGCGARFWGCLAAPGADRVLSLGMIEPASRPIDAQAMLGVLAGYAARGTRVLAAGADADALLSLRHALTRDGVSVAIAWDAKQASDLLEMVRPEVFVVDLGLPPRGAYEIVADLAAAESVPAVVLISRDEDVATRFLATLADRVGGGHALSRDRLLESARRRAEDPPSPRR